MDVLLSSIGIVSSVGRDAVTTCASVRAGVVRPSPIPGLTMLEADTNTVVPIIGHPVSPITDGFASTGRWLRMAEIAFRDLIRFGKLPPVESTEFWGRTGFIFVTAALDDSRFEFDVRCKPPAIEGSYLVPLLQRTGLLPYRDRCQIWSEGRSAPFRVLANSTLLMETFDARRIVILAVDSFLDGVTLEWLGGARRLKTNDNTVGLSPGEAAVALLIEEKQAARSRNAHALARVVACDHSRVTDAARRGHALAEGTTSCLSTPALQTPFQGDFYIDLNGETWRANEFGSAVAQISSSLLGQVRSRLCAGSVGDTGAAAGALNLALASRAVSRGYAHGGMAIVATSSENGNIGVSGLSKV